MNTLTTSEKSYLKYILSEMLKKEYKRRKNINVVYGNVDEEKVFLGTSYIARIFNKNKIPFDLSKNLIDCTEILKRAGRFSDMKTYKLTADILVTESMHTAKLVAENDVSYVNADLLKRLGAFKSLLDCEFKANSLSIHYVFKDGELIGFIMPVKHFG